MTFLELCQRTRLECGVSGTGPATVTSQTGQLLKIVNWVTQAWLEIQNMRPNWRFMWKEFTFNTVAGTRDYAPADVSITDLDQWDTNSFLIYKTATGTSDQNPLPFLEYGKWRPAYRNQMAERDNDRPMLFTLMPDDDSVRFEPCPDAIFTIDGDYKRTAQTFSASADTPTGFPSKFHMMIVYKAMQYYGFHESAPDVLSEGEALFDQWLMILEREQLPPMSIGSDPLA